MQEVKTWFSYILYDLAYAGTGLQSILNDPDSACTDKTHLIQVLKKDKGSFVGLLQCDRHKIVIKNSPEKSLLQTIRRVFYRSRPARALKIVRLLNAHHILTFHPIAIIEKRWGPIKRRSFLLMSFLEGESAIDYFSKQIIDIAEYREKVLAILSLFHVLEKNYIRHKDMNLTNIVFHQNKPYLVDLDAISHYNTWRKIFFRFQVTKMRKRFIAYWEVIPNLPDEIRALLRKSLMSPEAK